MSKYVDGIIGHAIGDAMGGTIGFESRNKLFKNPVTKMIGYDSYNVSLGILSDDIAMEIATIDSFINKGCFDYKDIMRNFKSWLEKNKFTTDGGVFDVENSCMQSISNFSKGCKLQECGQNDLHSTGNSSLMRILPVALYSYSNLLDENEIIKLTNEVSLLTHTHEISKLGCYIYVRYVIFLLQELDKNSAYCELRKLDYSYYSKESVDVYQRILKEDISKFNADEIRSSGYIVDTLEASIWVILQCNSFSESIISAINLGDDKVSAVTGSIAGIIYGYNDIPEEWLNVLKRKECIIDMALKFENKSSSLKKDVILGTIIGDIAGSRFEIVNNKYGKRFKLLHNHCIFTDDSVMTLAVAKAFLNSKEDLSDLKEKVIEAITNIGRKYPNCGYGPKFYRWIFSDDHMPYGSFGNGSAMRISSVGVAIKSIDRIKEIVNVITNISHNHADSIA